jgi:hypothetical protein
VRDDRAAAAGRPGYHQVHGTRFSHGYYYRGIHHRHWSRTVWSARHRCYFFYDPWCRAYFYWCRPAGCYFPVSYFKTAPPDGSDTPPAPAPMPEPGPVDEDSPAPEPEPEPPAPEPEPEVP